jgi:uncharacterized protein YjeT (DUF2065 family)
MKFLLVVLFAAFGLVLVLEGLPYFAVPGIAREVGRWVLRRSDASLRLVGLAMMVAGLAILYLVIRFGGDGSP